ncbi:MAG: hypothetical protein ACM3JG_05380 [Thiohalocapsa sp.]
MAQPAALPAALSVAEPAAQLVEPKARPSPFALAHGFTVAKRSGETNEDAWQHSHKGAGAVSDGASVSFDSAAWSRLLVRRYAQHPEFDTAWLAAVIGEYVKLYDRDNLPWMQQAAFDRGSFASLLGIRDCGGERIAILAVGDSLAVLCDGDRIVATFPYTQPEEFDQRPQLLSTNPAENKFLDEPGRVAQLRCEWDLGPLEGPAVLCMTDALGRWLLAARDDEPSPVARLRAIRKPRAFAHFVAGERAAGRLRRDDTTLLAYWDWRAEQ